MRWKERNILKRRGAKDILKRDYRTILPSKTGQTCDLRGDYSKYFWDWCGGKDAKKQSFISRQKIYSLEVRRKKRTSRGHKFTIDDLRFGGENGYSISESGVKNNEKWTRSNKFAAGRL
jgi:hypothetical protein